nr:von Willebrand factor A domain containing protein [Hymenolepis microstoma]
MKLNIPKILLSKRREGAITFEEQIRIDNENSATKPLRTDQWIEMYGLKHLYLTRDDLNWMIIESLSVNEARMESALSGIYEFEDRLLSFILNITRRINWMLSESRRTFGVNGTVKKVGVLIDASDIFLYSQRGAHFLCSVNQLLDEQLRNYIDAIYFAEFGTSVKCLWSEPQKFDETTLLKVKEYFRSGIRNAGGSNLLAGLKHMLRIAKVHDLEEILIVVGSLPDQPGYLLMEYLELADVLNPNIFFHFVSFDSQDTRVLETLSQLTRANPKRISLHVYSSLKEELIWTGDDMLALRNELFEAKKLAKDVRRLRLELENDRRTNLDHLLTNLWGAQEDGDILKFEETDDQPCILFLPKTSVDWISHHGLKAKRLDFYQMLTPYAMTKTTTFVPSIGKEVSGKTYTDAMVQLEWPDHSVKNVNINIPLLKNYQSCLIKHIGLIEKRLSWLQLPTYRPFGTLVEENVIIVIDLSFHNDPILSNIQSFVKKLIESQIAKFVKYFNIITIGSAVESLEWTMVECTRENLQRAWLWFKERGCSGTRNVMEALRLIDRTLNGFDKETVGVYLLTSGNSDQNYDQLNEYLELMRMKLNIALHVSLYSVSQPIGANSDYTVDEESLRALANSTGGRYQCFSDDTVQYSDDVDVLMEEIKCSRVFIKAANTLTLKLKQKRENNAWATSLCSTEQLKVQSIEHPSVDYTKVATTALVECRKNFIRGQYKTFSCENQKQHQKQRKPTLRFRNLAILN